MAAKRMKTTEAVEAKVNPVKEQTLSFTIEGRSSLIQHKWSEKAKAQMRAKHAGKRAKTREVRDP